MHRRTLRVVSDDWDLTIELNMAGGCGVHADQSMRLKLTAVPRWVCFLLEGFWEARGGVLSGIPLVHAVV